MSLSPTFSPIRLTIVDFLGVFLPGIVWTILLFTLWGMLDPSQGFPQNPNPLTIAYFLATGKDSFLTSKGEELGSVFYVGMTLLSVFLGYLNMALSTKPVEYISRFLCRFSPFDRKIQDYLFPYTEYFKNQSYYNRLVDILLLELNLNLYIPTGESFETTYHPFEDCKAIIKIRQSPLWEDVQSREALVRMLAALFLASFFNLGLAICQVMSPSQSANWSWFIMSLTTFILAYTSKCLARFFRAFIFTKIFKFMLLSTFLIFGLAIGQLVILSQSANWIWFITSLIITLILGHIFRYSRFREVEDVYISTLLVTNKERR